jgi:nitroreductase
MTQFLNRISTYPILPLFLSRTSSRAFSQERLDQEDLMALFEAARWAPSSYNNQPWRFVYARKGEKEWDTFLNFLVGANKEWCKDADTLVVILSKNNFEYNNKPSITARLDTGSAWMSLALEAHARDIVAHGMQGFDYDSVKSTLNIPDSFTVEAMIAIGKQGDKDALPEELRKKETPSLRKPLNEIVSRGEFTFK